MPAANVDKIANGSMTNGKISKPVPNNLTNGTVNNNNNNHNGTATSNIFQEPQKIANIIIEKKIRNLEKRKARLIELKASEDKGQQLEAEQKIAVKKLENVVEMIELLKEIGKNVTDSLNDFAKQMKRQQKKEQLEKQSERQHQDLERSKLFLNVEYIASRFSAAKDDFANGQNGAIKLESNQIEAVEKFVQLLPLTSYDSIESVSEKVNNLVDGNKREFIPGVSYNELKDTFVKMIESSYFAIMPQVENHDQPTATVEKDETVAPKPATDEIVTLTDDSNVEAKENDQTTDSFRPVHLMNQQIVFMRNTVVENELQHKDPAVVAVGSSGLTCPPMQMGPQVSTTGVSADNIVTTDASMSNHYSSHMYPAVTIPTQTFTNQNYTGLIPGNTQFIPVTQAMHQMAIQHEQTAMLNKQLTGGLEAMKQALQQSKQSTNNSEPSKPNVSNNKNSQTSQMNGDGGKAAMSNGAGGNHHENGGSNGHFKRRVGGSRGNGRGGNFGNSSYRGGRGGKNFVGYYGGNGNPHNGNGGGAATNGNFKPPMSHRPNNGQNRLGSYRNGNTNPRNAQNVGSVNNNNTHNHQQQFINQAPTVSAK